jgi:hypothetical protein
VERAYKLGILKGYKKENYKAGVEQRHSQE